MGPMGWRILITGATGVLGREIARRLHHREVEFVAACRHEEDIPAQIRYLSLDYAKPALLEYAFKDVDVLFLLIPFAEPMVEWAANAIGAARRAGVKLIVRSSVVGADSKSSYLWLRSEGEINDLLAASEVPSIIVRSHSFMQNFDRHYGEALRQGVLYLPEGEGKTAFVDAGDLACVICDMLINPFSFLGNNYTITGTRALSNAEAVSIMSHDAGRRISYVPVTEEITRRALEKTGASEWWTEFTLSRHRAVRDGLTSVVNDTFEKITGREPRSFEEFSEEMAPFIVPPRPSDRVILR